jgi:AAA domain
MEAPESDYNFSSIPDHQKKLGVYQPGETKEPRKLQGSSFLKHSQRAINEKDTLLGVRYLCRGGGMFIVAPSGHGKSTLVAQASIELACGMDTFGINSPTGSLRSLIIQCEDDEGDLIEMSRIINHLKLNEKQRNLVDERTHVEFVNDLTGANFLEAVDGFLDQWPADLLWINPYTAYLGADIKDDGANTTFLRNRLNPILTKHKCGCVIVHHTPKTNFRDTATWKPSDWMYSGAGAAVLTNWARAYLVIDPCDTHGVYKFIAAKRGKRIGWGNGFPVFEQLWAHSREDGQLLWVPADADQIALAAAKSSKSPDDLLKLIPLIDPIQQDRFWILAKERLGIGEKKARSFIGALIDEGKVHVHKMDRAGAKGGKGYARSVP